MSEVADRAAADLLEPVDAEFVFEPALTTAQDDATGRACIEQARA